MLEIRSVRKHFGGLQALRHVSFDVKLGVRHGLIGPNGAGKTTLMNVISGLERPTSGTVWLSGDNITRVPPYRRARRGVSRTFQIASLFEDTSLIQNVELAVIGREGMSSRFVRPLQHYDRVYDEARRWLETWNLEHRADTPVKELSHGERRLLEVVMALVAKPKLLLLDEPAAGLSDTETAELAKTFRSLSSELGFLLVEHNMNLVFGVCDQVTVLAEGKVIAEGSPEDVRNDSAVRDAYLGVDL